MTGPYCCTRSSGSSPCSRAATPKSRMALQTSTPRASCTSWRWRGCSCCRSRTPGASSRSPPSRRTQAPSGHQRSSTRSRRRPTPKSTSRTTVSSLSSIPSSNSTSKISLWGSRWKMRSTISKNCLIRRPTGSKSKSSSRRT